MSDSLIRLSLSAKGLQRVETVDHAQDFAFIVGNERYPCPSFLAEFLSPRISSLRSQDITIDEFSIKTEDPGHHFGTFLSIGFGREVLPSRVELSFLRSVCGELGNSELFEKTFTRKDGEITDDELKARIEFLSGVNDRCERDSAVVASHFRRFSVSAFDGLSYSVLESVLGDQSLVVRDEDSVFDVIYRRASADVSYFGLLEFVRFECLSDDGMRRALEFISSLFELLTFGIWSSLAVDFRFLSLRGRLPVDSGCHRRLIRRSFRRFPTSSESRATNDCNFCIEGLVMVSKQRHSIFTATDIRTQSV
jgi:hypothetical protein